MLSQPFLQGIQLSMEMDRSMPEAHGVPGRLQQILLNLIVNASEAMEGKGRLILSVQCLDCLPEGLVLAPSQTQDLICVQVGDSGPGMSQEVRLRVFEPFFSTKPTGQGTGSGLGLSVVYQIAEQEGLGLRVRSEEGQGSVFEIWIPRIRELEEGCEEDAQSPINKESGNTP